MVEISEDTKNGVKTIAEQFGKTKEEAKSDFLEMYKLFGSGKINLRGENVESVVLKALRSKYSAEFSRPTIEFEAYLIDTVKPKKIVTKEGKEMVVSNAYAITFNSKEQNPTYKFSRIAHFENNANKVNDLENGNFYKVRLSNNGIQGNVLKLTAVDITTWKKMDTKVEGFEDPVDVVKNIFQRVEIAEAEMKVGDKTGMFLVEGRVASVRLVDRKDGTGKVGIYKTVDESIDDDKEQLESMGGGMTVFVDENMVNCGTYSTAMFLGRFSMNDDGFVQMNAELVIPIIEVPFDPTEIVSGKQTKLTEHNENDDILKDSDL